MKKKKKIHLFLRLFYFTKHSLLPNKTKNTRAHTDRNFGSADRVKVAIVLYLFLLWKSNTVNWLNSNILQNIFFLVQWKKETRTGFEQHE